MYALTTAKLWPGTSRAGVKSIASRKPYGPRSPSASSAWKLAAAAIGAYHAASAVAYGAITRLLDNPALRPSPGTPKAENWYVASRSRKFSADSDTPHGM